MMKRNAHICLPRAKKPFTVSEQPVSGLAQISGTPRLRFRLCPDFSLNFVVRLAALFYCHFGAVINFIYIQLSFSFYPQASEAATLNIATSWPISA
jgi:hypothetical protein